MAGEEKHCKDCDPGSKRPAPNPGPRCATHWHEEKKRRKEANHDRTVQRTYGLDAGDYGRLYELQGGFCALCRRARGTGRKRLAVDHDHASGAVRGLLCSTCNQILGHARDDPRFFYRAAAYLLNPPANGLTK